MSELTIRPAREQDLPAILAVYEAARQFMRRSGNPTQWVGGYPSEEILRRDMADHRLYVLVSDGAVCGCFMLCHGPDPTYARIEGGTWRWNTPYGVIHRVASNGACRGVLAHCVAFARMRYTHLRIDTHADNLPMQRALMKAGFAHRGTIFLANGDPRLAYDWSAEDETTNT